MSPLARAATAPALTLVVGLLTSAIVRRLVPAFRVAWGAAVLAPALVGAWVYWADAHS